MSSKRPVVGLFSPGAMGASVGAALNQAGRVDMVLFAGDDRSEATHARAADAGLVDRGTPAAVIAESDIVLSICPPASAGNVSDLVAAEGFDGLFVDANAVAPDTARDLATSHARFVDGGIIGPPVASAGSTRLYLSGDEAGDLAALFDGSALDVRPIDGGPGTASAVKVAFASWSKGSAALLLAVHAFADAEGVADVLASEWEISRPDLTDRSEATAAGTGPKAWRFAGEMREIAAAFDRNGVPGGFHDAAAEIYRRLEDLKGRTEPGDEPTLAEAIRLIVP